MKISVALATYNGERFIAEQLESLAAQSRTPDELVVSDDRSTDRTIEVVEEFAREAPFPVRIYRNERNVGFSENFLRAGKLCEGNWVAFCDQDDVWLPEKLAVCERYMNMAGRKIMVVAHNAEIVDESLARSGVRYLNIRKAVVCSGRRLPNLWVASGFTMMFRSELLSDVPCDGRGPDPGVPASRLAHDVWICRLARIVGDVAILPDCLALYRRHGMTTTTFLAGGNQAVRKSRKFFQQIQALSSGGSETYRRHSRAAACQARAFGRLGREGGPEKWRALFLRAEIDYAEFSKWLLVRSCVYGSATFYRRLSYWFGLVFRNGYFRFNGYSWINARRIIKEMVFDLAMAVYGPREKVGGPGQGMATQDGDGRQLGRPKMSNGQVGK